MYLIFKGVAQLVWRRGLCLHWGEQRRVAAKPEAVDGKTGKACLAG